MIYKIAAVVLAVALCIVPVFAADSVDSIEYLCVEHNCIKPDGVPDAVCSVCYFSTQSPALISSVDTSLVTYSKSRAAAADDLYFGIWYPSQGRTYNSSDYSNGFDPLSIGALVYSVSGEEGSFDDIDNIKSAFAYSPVREAYIAEPVLEEYEFLYIWFTDVGSDSDKKFVLYPFIYDSLTVNLQMRTTLKDGSYAKPSGARLFYSMAVLRNDSVLGNSYFMYSTAPSGVGYWTDRVDLAPLNGYQNIWMKFPIDVEVWDSSYSTTNPFLGTFCSVSTEKNGTPGAAQMKFAFSQGIQMVEIKKFNFYPGDYDVLNGVFPDSVPDGGQIVGSTWPLMADAWVNQQFSDAVNSELSDTATSVDGNIDTLQGFETQVHADLDRYLNESGIADYTIPSSLGSAFSWVSNKFTSFINVNGELKTILLFPAYLGILVAMVHGLEFAGRTLSHKARKGGGDG